ncbi:MAG: glycosyltransferase family 39 protein [Planctomycetota bacterium]
MCEQHRLTCEFNDIPHEQQGTGRLWLMGICLAGLYLAAAVYLLPAYGPTWDCVKGEYPWGQKILAYVCSDHHDLLSRTDEIDFIPQREPHPDFDAGMFPWFEFWPVSAILSALSCNLFWTQLGWLPAMSAYNVVIPVFVALLMLLLVRFFGRRLGPDTGIAAALFLVLSPRFFTHAFNNIRDLPEACLYGFAVTASYLALTRKALRWWILAGAMIALALAQKPNALFIPAQMGLFFVVAVAVQLIRKKPTPAISWKGALLGASVFLIVYFVISPPFWHHTLERLEMQLSFILRRGNTLAQAAAAHGGEPSLWSRISFDGPLHVLWTTPPTVLVLALIGLITPSCNAVLRILLITWFAVPAFRTSLPGMHNFDSIRHFIEFYPALCVLAGLGLHTLWTFAWRIRGGKARRFSAAALIGCVAVLPCLAATIRTFPNGLCYFNFIVGGLKGAQERDIQPSTDYWGNSYWQGLEWLNRNAEPGSGLLVPVAGHIVKFAAPVRLREDIRLCHSAMETLPAPMYVMYITRPEWYGPMIQELELTRAPVHEIQVDGATILRIYEVSGEEEAKRMFLLWKTHEADLKFRHMFLWVQSSPERQPAFIRFKERIDAGEDVDLAENLKKLLPQSLHENIPDIVWYIRNLYKKPSKKNKEKNHSPLEE